MQPVDILSTLRTVSSILKFIVRILDFVITKSESLSYDFKISAP